MMQGRKKIRAANDIEIGTRPILLNLLDYVLDAYHDDLKYLLYL
jgi:hypothetical protein